MHFHKKEFFQTRLEREMFYNSEIAYSCIFFLLLPHANACRGLHGQFRSGKEQQQHSARKTLKSCGVFLGFITVNY